MMDTSTKLLIHIYRIYRSILLVLPLNFIIKVARIKAYLIAYVFPKDRNIALTQLRYVFKNKLPDKRLQQLSFLTFANVGQIAVESIVIKKLLTKENNEFKYVSSTNRKFVEEIFQAKKSCLALSGHIGCFELLAAFYAADGIDVSVIGRAPNYKLLDIFAKRLRHSYGIESIWREDPASFRKLINAFKTGRVVAALIDQDTAVESTFAPFFGLPALSPSSLIKMAIKYQIPIISSFIIRETPYHHCVITENIEYNPNSPDVIADILKVFNSRLENLITKHPEQWIWWHRRWRRQPGIDYVKHHELLPSTKNYLSWLNEQTQNKN